MISEKTIGRLSVYRRLLNTLAETGETYIYSHQLGSLAGSTAAQVRRDLMVIGCSGSPARGYEVPVLIEAIGHFLDAPQGMGAAMVGSGRLGQAILAYFRGRRPKLSFSVAFDADESKTGRTIHGCPCHPLADLPRLIAEKEITVAVLAVPAREAQTACDALVRAGVRSVLNFAPVRLRVPRGIHVEDMDMTTALEKAAYFARVDESND